MKLYAIRFIQTVTLRRPAFRSVRNMGITHAHYRRASRAGSLVSSLFQRRRRMGMESLCQQQLSSYFHRSVRFPWRRLLADHPPSLESCRTFGNDLERSAERRSQGPSSRRLVGGGMSCLLAFFNLCLFAANSLQHFIQQ